MASSVSFFSSASYSAGVISPFLNCALQFLTSTVCGKDPMVVVGKSGSFKISCCVFFLEEKAFKRSASLLVMAFTLCLICSWWISAEVLRLSIAFLFSVSLARAAVSGFSEARSFNVTTSAIFCLAKASHCLISGLYCFLQH